VKIAPSLANRFQVRLIPAFLVKIVRFCSDFCWNEQYSYQFCSGCCRNEH